MKGRIVEISFDSLNTVYVKHGVKGGEQYRYDGRYPGGNGTYVMGGEYESYIWLKVYVYEFKRCYCFDIKDMVLELNNRKKVSSKMMNTLVKNNEGKKIRFNFTQGELRPMYSDLNLI